MRIVVWLAVAALAFTGGCEKKQAAPAPPPVAAESVATDGTRVVPVNVNDEGFDPAKIRAKAGSSVDLMFTRHTKSECGAQVKVAGGPVIELPVGQPVKVAVKVPPSGELGFACGMDMMTGVIIAE